MTAIDDLNKGWTIKRFEELFAEPQRNGIYKTKEFHGRGQKIINMGELFGYDFISGQEMKRVELTPKELEKSLVKDGDLLFARRSLVLEGSGKCSLVVRPSEDTTFESSIIRTRLNKNEAEPKFYYYLFRSPLGRALMSSIATQTAVSGITGSNLVQLRVPHPPLLIQRKIAAILSAYDDLIENNTRRIEILEEMARSIYCEWFVKFRFPGHEQVQMVDSELGLIPEGWEVKQLDDIVLEIIDYRGKTPKKLGGDWSESGILAISAKNIKQGKLINLDKSNCVDEALYKKWMKSELKQGDILMTSEAPLGELYYLVKHHKFCLSQRVYSIRANPDIIHPPILFSALYSPLIQEQIYARQSGTTVLGIRQTELRKVAVIVPLMELQLSAARMLNNFFNAIETLQVKNDNLRKTRDLLLPRLISGEIDVENLDINTGEIAA
ncbi:restriction endonuclease subunit S [Microcoleus sp. w1-18aA5]|uniref:restriction endonuclease subunit S n=1 Tax=Microcoleus sp. w1-18aA5 TaxID=2818982 RepID=UPI002FD07F2C